jgi:uncharacterized protein (DUF2461 family)
MPQIDKSTIKFLSDLKLHNDRDWFHENHIRYEQARSEFETFVQALIDAVSKFDPILKGL